MGSRPLFPLGQYVATPGAIEAMAVNGIAPGSLLDRHITGDWGDVDAHDKRANDAAATHGTRTFSAYEIKPGLRFWVITEADRSSTTILLPEEY